MDSKYFSKYSFIDLGYNIEIQRKADKATIVVSPVELAILDFNIDLLFQNRVKKEDRQNEKR